MKFNENVFQLSEKIIFSLRQLYLDKGYNHYRMSKFEEYDLYARNKDFLVSDNVITFTDIGGKLLALKPDVTLSIVKNSVDDNTKTNKLFYNENVYRVAKETGSYKEIMQTGVECFGRVGKSEIYEILTLAAESIKLFSKNAVLVISDIGILSQIIERLELSGNNKALLYKAITDKNIGYIKELTNECSDKSAVKLLEDILSINGGIKQNLSFTKDLLSDTVVYGNFIEILEELSKSEYADMLSIDFSLTGDTNYYNGIIFKGFLPNVPNEVISGGQYDNLMKKLGRISSAIGFAVYTDNLNETNISEADENIVDEYINIALPKGRLGEKVYSMFKQGGYPCDEILTPGRKLIFENCEKKVRYFWVKPSDVSIYVEHGAADIGVAGKDILAEYEPDVYELCDLKQGKCRMTVAGPKDYTENPDNVIKVATKFVNIAKKYYMSKGRDIDIIKLNGSIEIAPILGLSNVIVDIVETGNTLKENNLEVKETIMDISARLISNKSSYKFKSKQIDEIKNALSKLTEEM